MAKLQQCWEKQQSINPRDGLGASAEKSTHKSDGLPDHIILFVRSLRLGALFFRGGCAGNATIADPVFPKLNRPPG